MIIFNEPLLMSQSCFLFFWTWFYSPNMGGTTLKCKGFPLLVMFTLEEMFILFDHYLSGTHALLYTSLANKPPRTLTFSKRYTCTSSPSTLEAIMTNAASCLLRDIHTHNPPQYHHHPSHLARNNLKGDIRNKFNTSANPRSALRTKRNLILAKPLDRISALAQSCIFTAIPSTLTSHTLAQFPYISPPLCCLFL